MSSGASGVRRSERRSAPPANEPTASSRERAEARAEERDHRRVRRRLPVGEQRRREPAAHDRPDRDSGEGEPAGDEALPQPEECRERDDREGQPIERGHPPSRLRTPTRRPMKVRPLALCGAVAAIAALVTLAVALVPDLRFGYRDPAVRVAIETAATLIALVVAYIFIGRYLRSHRLDHLGAAVGLFTLALSNACTTVNVALGPWEQLRDFAWGSSLAGIFVLGAAAFLPATTVVRTRREVVAAAVGAVLLSAALARHARRALRGDAGADGLRRARPARALPLRQPRLHWREPRRDRRPRGRGRRLRTERRARRPRPAADVARRRRDGRRVRPPALLPLPAGPGRLGLHRHRLPARLLPASSSSARRSRSSGTGAASRAAAVLEERRRLARELHDGVAQELAFIRRRAGRLAELRRDGVEIPDRRRPRARGLAPRDRGARPARHEPLTSRWSAWPRRLAAECGIEVQVNVARRDRHAPRGARRAGPDHLRGGPQRRPPRRRAPRAAWSSRASRWPSASSTTASASATAPTAASASRLRADRACASAPNRSAASSRWNPSAARVPSCRWCCHRPARVLVADDHAPTREDIATALGQDGGFEVIATAEDAPGAVDAALREQPDLALLDVNMPGSGLAAAWEITARLPATRWSC